MDIGLALAGIFGQQEAVEVANPPDFLKAWPPVGFRRLEPTTTSRTVEKQPCPRKRNKRSRRSDLVAADIPTTIVGRAGQMTASG
jgi:hypothetical protein